MREVIAPSGGGVFDRCALGFAAFLTALLGAQALSAAPASAENVHVFTQVINDFSGYTKAKFSNPTTAAADSSLGPNSGDVYVSDNGHARMVKFTAAGTFLLMWGKNVNEGSGNPNICTNAGPPTDICKNGQFAESQPGALGNVFSVAVDSSGGPSNGDIYVQATANIQKFDPSGNLVTSFGGTPFPGAVRPSSDGNAITVDQAGNVYALRGTTLTKYDENGVLLGTLTTAVTATGPSEGGGIAIDPSSGNFYIVAQGTFSSNPIEKINGTTGADLGRVNSAAVTVRGAVFDPTFNELLTSFQHYPEAGAMAYRFNGSGQVVEPGGAPCTLGLAGCGASEKFGNLGEIDPFYGGPNNIGINTRTHKVYVLEHGGGLETEGKNQVLVFTLINVPKVTTGGTENVTRTSVKFLGHVDPDGAGEVTTCKFEYGTTKSYELGSALCQPPTTNVATDVSSELPADTLKSQTTYHYRLIAGNANGNRPATDQTFTTLTAVPSVTTEPASAVARLTATFNGSYGGDGVDTSYFFEYGHTKAYGQKTPLVHQGTASGPQTLAVNVHGLFPYYVYHYRLVAQNKYGTTVGGDQMFQTEEPAAPVVEDTSTGQVGPDSAVLKATIDPGEGQTAYRFEYGVTDEYGRRTLIEGPIEPESSDHTASTEVLGLTPGTTYHFRVMAINLVATVLGPDQTFTTPSAPVVEGGSAQAVTTTTAKLSALVNPGLELTTYHFEYGQTTAYGSSTPQSVPLGPDNAVHPADATLTSLAPGTAYHFRIVATNPIGTTNGVDHTFTTAPPEEKKEEPKQKPCKKGFVRRHGKCVRKHRRHAKHHRRNSGSGNG